MTVSLQNAEHAPSRDAIARIRLSTVSVPLRAAVSDAKILTGRQKPLTEVFLLLAEIETRDGHEGVGFSYTLRHGASAQFAFAREVAPYLLGEDPDDISRLWIKLTWQGASVGCNGVAVQSIAALDTALWDMKARRAGLSLAKFIGAQQDAVRVYNTSGGYLQAPIEEVIEKAQAALARGIGGIKIKVGQPDQVEDLRRVEALRKALGPRVPIMADVNQQWDRTTALRMGRALEDFSLEWIEEPLPLHDVAGHRELAQHLVTPIGTGEMLTSEQEVGQYIDAGIPDILMFDAPRVGGVTPFLRLAMLAEQRGIRVVPHFVMEIHIHLAATLGLGSWVEHFEWLEPAFEERLEMRDGGMIVPTRPGLGLTPSPQAREWTVASADVSRRRS